MKRRSFITLASVAPLGLASSAEVRDGLDQARETWRESVENRYSGTFVSEEGGLRLEVSLIGEDDSVTEKIVKTADGEMSVFTFEGVELPRGLRPKDGIIKSFRFFWDKKEIPIEKRFWNDFGGCHIEKTTLTKDKIPAAQKFAFGEFLDNLEAPRVILSADGGTALIEWKIIDTDACCGHMATVRWMIGKTGTVMRHRHTTPSNC